MSVNRTYLDHNATAPLRNEARAMMLEALECHGNPSSVHAEGRAAHALIENARADVAAYLSAHPEEIVFTSGATESNNWVIRAPWAALVISAVEHDSIRTPANDVAIPCHVIPVDRAGVIDLGALDTALASMLERIPDEPTSDGADKKLDNKNVLVSIQAANPETGIVQPLTDVRAVINQFEGALLHVDAVQVRACHRDLIAGARPDFISLSAHKIGGPKGAGALFVRAGVSLDPMMSGGGQELRRRPGTQNVAAITGFGAATRVAASDLETSRARELQEMRDELESGIRTITPDAVIVGASSDRLCNTTCICAPPARAETLVMALDIEGIAISAGSACSSGKVSTSHVLKAMGLDRDTADSAIRVSLGWSTTSDDIAHFLKAWQTVTQRILAHHHEPPHPHRATA